MGPVTESDISRSTQTAWKAVFGSPLPVGAPPKPGAARAGRMLVAKVQILGGVSRTVLIACPWEEAHKVAARFYRTEDAALDDALVRDVFGELANMVGGLIKRHYPNASRLTLPEVREGGGEDAPGTVLVQAVFECGRSPLSVRLLQSPS